MDLPTLLSEYNAMNIKDAAEKAIHLGKQLQAVVAVGKVLDEICDLENARVEAERDTKEAQDTKKKIIEDLARIRYHIGIAETDFETVKSASKKHETNTTVKCNRLIAEARKERDSIIKAATKGSAERVDKATQTVNSLQDKRDALLKDITNSQSALTNLENQMKALRDRLG